MAGMARSLSLGARAALSLLFAVVVLLTASAVSAQGTGGTVDILTVSGPVDATIVDYLAGAIDKAEAEGVEVVVVELDSEGLRSVDLADALDPLTDRDVPVAVWVGPPGARATGGAAWVAGAADVLAVAPSALVGGAGPFDGSDAPVAVAERLDEAGLREGAVVPTLGTGQQLPDDAALPTGVDTDDVRVVSDTALIDEGIVDIVAPSVQDVLVELDGRTVTLADGTQQTLSVDPETANVRFNNQGLWGRILHAVADPTLAYLLLTAGLMAIAFEFFQPGFGVSGLTGLFCAGLATYGLTVLPTRPFMALLVVAGVALLSVDLAVGGFGLVTLAGTAALAVGSVRLYAEDVGVPGWVIVAVVTFAVVFFVGIMTTVLRAQGAQARAGAARVTGRTGVVRSMLNPEGHVFVDGALWRARAPEAAGKVRTGTTVRVTGTSDGLTLDVELVEEPSGDSERAPVA